MVQYVDLYNYYSHFSPISVDEWLQAEAIMKPVSLAKGDKIYESGEIVGHAFAIRKGVVKTYYTTLEGKEFIKIFLTDGQLVSPYIENFTDIPSRTTAEAITDVSGLIIPFGKLMEVLNSSPAFIKLHLRLIQMFYAVKEKREHELLTQDATQRYENFLNDYGDHVEKIPNMFIASYLGITPVSLSRLRKNFKK